MFAQTDESMESSSVPCLVEKAVSMLIAMGSHGRPKSLKKLENALRPCTMVAPYVDPLEALEIANRRSQHPEPPVLNVQHNKVKVYYSSKSKPPKTDFRTKLLMNAQESGRDYDLALPGGETHDEITRDALAWLSEWETREGTQEQLTQGLFERCQKKVDLSSLEMVTRLHSRGFLEVHQERVSYSLPQFDSEQCRVLEVVRSNSGAKDITMLFHLYQNHCKWNYPEVVSLLLSNVYNLYDYEGGSVLTSIEHWGNSGHQLDDESSCDDAAVHPDTRTLTGDGFEDVLRDMLGAYFLFCLRQEDRPDNLSDLMNLIKPQSLILAVPPSQILHSNVKHRQIKTTKKRGSGGRRDRRGGVRRQSKERAEVVLGIARGETSVQKRIPLTIEGLLGIHSHIATPSHNPGPLSCATPSEHQATVPMNSPPSWLPGDKPRANGLSKEFASTLFEQLKRRASNSNAVPVPASQREKEGTISRILEWLDAHRSPPGHEVPKKLKSIKQLQRELIGLCANRPRRIAPGTIVRCLQKSGYITVHNAESPEVTYNLPVVRKRPGPVHRDDGQAPWQQHAEEFRQSVSKCYSVYFKRAFPPGVCANRPLTPKKSKFGKSRQPGGAYPQTNKRLKHL